ncbi:unnamed protein product [Ixodes hexagonus]
MSAHQHMKRKMDKALCDSLRKSVARVLRFWILFLSKI